MADQFVQRGDCASPLAAPTVTWSTSTAPASRALTGQALSGDHGRAHPRPGRDRRQPQHHPRRQEFADPSGIRLGTPCDHPARLRRGQDPRPGRTSWPTCCWPAPRTRSIPSAQGRVRRAKLDFNVLNVAKLRIRKLAKLAGIDFKYKESGYPHFYYIDDERGKEERRGRGVRVAGQTREADVGLCGFQRFVGVEERPAQATSITTPNGVVKGTLAKVDDFTYQLQVPVAKAGVVGTWLHAISRMGTCRSNSMARRSARRGCLVARGGR